MRRRPAARRQYGALAAVCIIVVVHLVISTLIYPNPQPRTDLRRKLAALTRGAPAQLIVAGDSRAECGLIPDLLAKRVGLDTSRVINMAAGGCDPPATLAGYRAFCDRFAARPIVVIGVSLVGVNDHGAGVSLSDPTLWSVGLLERLRLTTPRRAFSSIFLPEREWVRSVLGELLLREPEIPQPVPEQGYAPLRLRKRAHPLTVQQQIAKFNGAWFDHPVLDGVRWRLFRDAISVLRANGVQVVVLDSPIHPTFVEALAGTPAEAQDALFHRQLADFCRVQDVPCLRYTAEDLSAEPGGTTDPGAWFDDVVHLSRAGAERLSVRVGDDLAMLLDTGVLRLSVDSGGVAGAIAD